MAGGQGGTGGFGTGGNGGDAGQRGSDADFQTVNGNPPTRGGAAGQPPSGDGQPGESSPENSRVPGAGGGGGANGAEGSYTGGDGGAGGNALSGGSLQSTPGGGGGAGGNGYVASSANYSPTGPLTIAGGTGGKGGNAGSNLNGNGNSTGGGGGDGGTGLILSSTVQTGTVNTGVTIKGGNGGVGGTGAGAANGADGLGGAGIVGANVSVTNLGTIQGGTGRGGQADAIDFTGGSNNLTLSQGGVVGKLSGGIGVGGTVTVNPGTAQGASVTLVNVIHDYTGPAGTTAAGAVIKAGAGTLTLTGANTYTGSTTINAGTLQLGDNGSTGSLAAASAITVGTNGTLAVNHTNLLTLGNTITGSGALQQNGTGGLKLTAANAGYTGAVALNAGTLELGQLTSVGTTGAITFAAGMQTLQIDVVGTLGRTLTAVGTGDRLDFQALEFSGAQRTYDATTRTLTVSNGASSNTVRFDAASTLTNNQLVLSADADGSAIVTVRDALPAAPTGSFPLNGNRVIFDGTTNVTATKGDALIVTVDPQNFNGGAERDGNVVLSTIDGHTATIQNAFLTSDGIPNTYVPQGDFLVGRDGFSLTSTKQNSILIGLGSDQITDVVDPSLAAGSHFISGGVGRVDPTDGATAITIGGKGKWAVYANAGDDRIDQDAASTSGFDSASVVNVLGQNGDDQITLTNAANKASIFVSGGAGLDSISVVNGGGATTIFGGDDSSDGADRITFNGVNGAGGTSVIFGNGGNDTISVGGGGALDSTSTSTVYGGFGDDRITMSGTKATLNAIGGEGADSITVSNTGNTFITGGNLSGADQSLDGADTISFTGSGNVLIYGNLGDDRIDFFLNDTADPSTVNIYGGRGSDTITETLLAGLGGQAGTKAASVFIAGGEDGDTIIARGNGGAVTIYGGTSSSDSTDGADSIVYTGGTGPANIFANGGNDTVSIGQLGTDTTNTATVYGGGGADSIVISGQASASEALVVYGNEGADTFSIAKGTGQTVTIADFKASEGDALKLTALGGTNPGTLQVTTGSYQTLQQALDAAANTAKATTSGQAKAAGVIFAGSTYVVIDNTAGAGFQATDQAIKLTGVTDLVGLVGATTLSA